MEINGRVARVVHSTMVHRGGSSVMRAPADSMHGPSGEGTECSNTTLL